jgi:uncharacterized protein (TIGR03437 family)
MILTKSSLIGWLLVLLLMGVPVCAQTVLDVKAPAITTVSPGSVTASGPGFALTVNGSNFVSGALIMWNGDPPAAPTFISAAQLSVFVPPDLIASPGDRKITVQNPGAISSNPVVFTVTPAALTLTSLSPGSAISGGPPFLVTVRGTAFASDAIVEWDGSPLSTTFVNSTQLIAGVRASLIAAPGSASVTVRVGPGRSNSLAFPLSPEPATTPFDGIINLASGGHPAAPGSLISIYGLNLAPGEAASNQIPAPTTLNGTSVRMNDISAPLLYVSRNQINAQVPFEVAPGGVTVVIQAGGLTSAAAGFVVYPTAPGVWRLPQGGHVLALNYPDGTLNSQDHPILPGQFVTVYLTGQGEVTNPVATGAAAPDSPFSIPVAPAVARIGGQPAQIAFVGLAPGFIGLLQMNLQIPDVPVGEQKLEISIGNVPSNPTTISIGAQ